MKSLVESDDICLLSKNLKGLFIIGIEGSSGEAYGQPRTENLELQHSRPGHKRDES